MTHEDEKDKARVALLNALKTARQDWAVTADLIAYRSKLVRARFVSLRSEGFTHAEAMQLCLKEPE